MKKTILKISIILIMMIAMSFIGHVLYENNQKKSISIYKSIKVSLYLESI